MNTTNQIKELRAEWTRIGLIARGLMDAPVRRNLKHSRETRIEMIRKCHEQQDVIEAQIMELERSIA
jgi:hypothetical protein